jgi:hypothetical protein
MRIEVSQLPPVECSPNSRCGWWRRYEAGKVYQAAVYYECIQAKNALGHERRPSKKLRLDLTFVFPCRRKRDEDNLRARFKPGQDALVIAGLIEGDAKDNLVLGDISIEVDRLKAPLTVIELKETAQWQSHTVE